MTVSLLLAFVLLAVAGAINVPPRGRHHTPVERPRTRRARTETRPALKVATP